MTRSSSRQVCLAAPCGFDNSRSRLPLSTGSREGDSAGADEAWQPLPCARRRAAAEPVLALSPGTRLWFGVQPLTVSCLAACADLLEVKDFALDISCVARSVSGLSQRARAGFFGDSLQCLSVAAVPAFVLS